MSIENDLNGISEQEYGANYRAHVLEIYKSYVQSAEKISDRRQAANSFFLTLNSAIVALVSYVNSSPDSAPKSESLFWFVAISGMTLSFLWYRLIRSYQDLNTGKFKVLQIIEKQLPLRPYDAEWAALGKGRDSKLYLPFTRVEILVPWLFFVIHLFVFLKSLL